MKIKEKTHHHIRRGYHAITFVTSVICVAFFSWVLGIALASVNADQSNSASKPIILNAPDVQVGAGNKEETTKKSHSVTDPSVTVVPAASIQQRYVLQDGEVQPIFIFKDQFPKFIGQTNVPDGVAILDIFGINHVTGKTKVDSNGNWSWESTLPLAPGTYTFNIKMTDGQSSKALASDKLLFEVVLDKDKDVIAMNFNNKPQLGNNGVLFDVRATIPKEYKKLAIGNEVKADIKFINFGSPNKAVDVEVQYTITDEEDRIISQNSETMAVKDELEFTKSFLTSDSLASGEYTLTVAVPSQDLVATSTDKFELQSHNDLAKSSETSSKSPFSNKALLYELLGALLFLGIIIGYMEYNKVVVLSRNIKQLTENDLLAQTN